MSTAPRPTIDWALAVAERIVGDIPHAIVERSADDLPERMAALLRLELSAVSPDRRLSAAVERVVWALPDYLPEQTTARLRAKLIGALLAAGALGEHLRPLGAMPVDSAPADGLVSSNNEVDP